MFKSAVAAIMGNHVAMVRTPRERDLSADYILVEKLGCAVP